MNNNTSNVLLGLNKAGRVFSRDSQSSFILITQLFFLHPEQKRIGLAAQEHTSTKNSPAFMPLSRHSEVLGFIHTGWGNAACVKSCDHQGPLFLTLHIPGIGCQLRTI